MSGRREQILEEALAIADKDGLDAVSMRRVAERVGVTPMALYPHVGGKVGLLDAMVGRLLDGLPAKGGMRDFARALRVLIRRHPWAATLLFARPAVTADAVALVDRIYLELLDRGVPPAEVPRLERLLSTLVIGFAASETGGRFEAQNPRGRRDEASGQARPGHAELARWLDRKVDWDAEFEADLDDLERLIQTVVDRQAGAPGTLGAPTDAQP